MVGPKPAAQLPAAVPSFVPPSAPGKSRWGGGGPKPVGKPPGWTHLATEPQLLQPGRPGRSLGANIFLLRSHLGRHQLVDRLPHSRAPVEPRTIAEVPVEQVAQKRKASSPLPTRTLTPPTSLPSPTCWKIARSRIKGRFKDYITPPVDNIADLPR